MNNKLKWATVIKYRKQAAEILLNQGIINKPSSIGFKADEHAKIVKLANQLHEQDEQTQEPKP